MCRKKVYCLSRKIICLKERGQGHRYRPPTYGKYVAVELSGENKRQLFIPRNFLHGFAVLSPYAIFAYKVDNVYNKASEFGIRYDSPEINVNWGIPADKIITSEKDRLANTLADLQKRQRG